MDEFSDVSDVEDTGVYESSDDVSDACDVGGELSEDTADDTAETVDFDRLDVLGEDIWENGAGETAATLDLDSLELLGEDLPEDVSDGPSELDEMLSEYDRMCEGDVTEDDGAPQKVKTLHR